MAPLGLRERERDVDDAPFERAFLNIDVPISSGQRSLEALGFQLAAEKAYRSCRSRECTVVT